MKKICFTVTNDLNYDQRMIRICSTLSAAGYQVVLIGRTKKNSPPLVSRNFKQKRLNCFWEKGKLFYVEYNVRLFFYLLFTYFDAVCSIDLDSILSGYWAATFKRKIKIYDAHEFFTEVPEVVKRPTVQKAWEWIGRQTIPKYTYCYTVCDSLKEVFRAKYQVDFEVIRNVPFRSLETASNPAKAAPFTLLYQGVLNDGRGLEELMHALTKVDQLQLKIAGEGDLSDKLRALCKELKLEDKVEFLGYLSPEALKKETLEADIGINLLQNKGLNYYYSLANKFFDYIQALKPSINMNFPEYAHINQQHEVSVLVDNLKPESLILALNKLSQNPVLYQKLQKNCVKARKIYVWEKESEKLLNFYAAVFNNT